MNILIVEDDWIASQILAHELKKEGHTTRSSATYEDTMNIINNENNKIDYITMDVGLKSEKTGLDTAAEIKKIRNIPIIFITAYPTNVIKKEIELRKLDLIKDEIIIEKPYYISDILFLLNKT